MAILIIILSVLLTYRFYSLSLSPLSKKLPGVSLKDKLEKDSLLVKIGAFILIALYSYYLFNSIKDLFITYGIGLDVSDIYKSVLDKFSSLAHVTRLLLVILLGVFLLMKAKSLAVISVFLIFIINIIKNTLLYSFTFFSQKDLINSILFGYLSTLPEIIVSLALLMIFIALHGKVNAFRRYNKIIKYSPFFLLGYIVYYLITALMYKISIFEMNSLLSIIFCLVDFSAFYLIFKGLIPMITEVEQADEAVSSFTVKEKILLVLIAFFTPIVFVIFGAMTSLSKLICTIVVTVALLIAHFKTKGKSSKVRITVFIVVIIISVIITALVPFIISFVSQLVSQGNAVDPDKCPLCQGSGLVNEGFWDWHTCPACRGTGIPPI